MNVRIKNPIIIVGSGGGSGESVELPILNALTISKSNDIVSANNPTTNGNFLRTYKFYFNEELKFEQSESTYALTQLPNGAYAIYAKAAAVCFKDSPKSNELSIGVYGITYDLRNMSCSITTSKITSGRTLTFKLNPTEGKYLPEFITIEINGENIEYVYNSYSGAVTVSDLKSDYVKSEQADGTKLITPFCSLSNFMLEIDYIPRAECFEIADGDVAIIDIPVVDKRPYIITIKATALDMPKLRIPVVGLDECVVWVDDLPNANLYELIVDGEIKQTKLQLKEE